MILMITISTGHLTTVVFQSTGDMIPGFTIPGVTTRGFIPEVIGILIEAGVYTPDIDPDFGEDIMATEAVTSATQAATMVPTILIGDTIAVAITADMLLSSHNTDATLIAGVV